MRRAALLTGGAWRRILVIGLAVTVAASGAACRPSAEVRPAFTKEGRAEKGQLPGSILFTGRDRRTSRIFRLDLDRAGRAVAVSPTGVEERSPALQPDGRLLATAARLGGKDAGIYVRPAGGGELRGVVTGSGVFDYPSWSPDGTSIVYAHADGPSSDWDLFVVPAAGGEPRQLTKGGGHDWDPAWSPRGNVIAFTSSGGGDNAIWTIDLGSMTTRKLVDSRGEDVQPAWSPDGTQLAFSSNRELERWQLFAYDTGAGADHRIIRTTGMDRFPTWSPDGRYILVSVGYPAVYRADGGKFPDGSDRWRLSGRLALASAWIDRSDSQ